MDYGRDAKVGVASIVLIGKLIVLVRRGPDLVIDAGVWTPPNGTVRVGKTIWDCVHSSMQAQTGLLVEPLRETPALSFLGAYDDRHRSIEYGEVTFAYFCRVVSGDMRAGAKMQDVQGFRSDQIANMKIGLEQGQILKDGIAKLRELGEITDARQSTFPPPPA